MTTVISDEFKTLDQDAVIKVCGVGGGGGNAVGRMIEGGLDNIEFITINTDSQALRASPAGTRIQIGENGLGAGAQPEIAEAAAREDRDRIRAALEGADMIFLTAGLGGGTGTGAAPVVAEVAQEIGALTVAIVTLPFSFENEVRMANALRGVAALQEHVDALIVVPNDRLALLCKADTTLLGAFHMADEVLYNGVRAISSLITVSGLINLDFADVRTVMLKSGRALMGIGTAEGEDRAMRAANEAIVCPLLEKSSIDGALGVIVNVKGGSDITMLEVLAAVSAVKDAAHAGANIIFGAVLDDEPRPEIQVTVIAAGFAKEALQPLTTIEDGPISSPEQPKAAVSGFDLFVQADEPATPEVSPDPEGPVAEAEPTVEDKKGQFLFFPDEAVPPPESEDGRREPMRVVEPEDLDKPTFQREDEDDEPNKRPLMRRQVGQG